MKRIIKMILPLLTVLVLSACSTVDYPNAKPTKQPQEAHADPLSYAEVFNKETDFDNRFGNAYAQMFETEEAYYYLIGYNVFMKYSDKDTGYYGVLCGKPECMHEDDPNYIQCNGYIDCAAGYSVGIWQNKLYYVGLEENVYTLFCMELDGSRHQKVFSMPCDRRYCPMRLDIHRGIAYCCNFNYDVNNGSPISYRNVTSWDLETGEFTVIFDSEHEGSDYLYLPQLFYFGKYVYIAESYPLGELGYSALDIYRWDTDNKTLETVFTTDGKTIKGDCFSVWVEAEDRIYAAPQDGDDGMTLYSISNGRIEAIRTFDLGGIFLREGACIWYYFGNDEEKRGVEICDYNGNTVYKGKWKLDYVEGTDETDYSLDAVFGDVDRLFFIYCINDADNFENRMSVVEYEIGEGIPEGRLLGVFNE